MLPAVATNAEHARLLEDGPAIPVTYGSRIAVYNNFIVHIIPYTQDL